MTMMAAWTVCAVAVVGEPGNLLRNPGFEAQTDGVPEGWKWTDAATLVDEAPHSGERCARLVAGAPDRLVRQVVPEPETRLYTASGWFRGRDLRLDGGYLRFYFHILYRDRPYADTTHAYVDLPTGSYEWRRIAVRLVPRTEWPVAEIWCSVAATLAGGSLDFDDLAIEPSSGERGVAVGWSNGARPRVLTDLSTARPAEALSPTLRRGCWQTIGYAAGGREGTLLWAAAETAAPPVTIPLGAEGWHAVFLGLADPASLGCLVEVKLSGDAATVPRAVTAGAIEEVLFKVADLTGQDLVLAQRAVGHARPAGLAYVKLVPLSADEVAREAAERTEPWPLVTTMDGFSFLYERRCTSAEELLQETEIYRNSDFGTAILQYGGADMANYRSAVGCLLGDEVTDFARSGDRHYAEAVRIMAERGINPTKVLLDGLHNVGMKVLIGCRPGAWRHTEPLGAFFDSPFFRSHPEWWCVARDGSPIPRMSFAVPEVRAHLLAMIREAVAFGADGACVIYVRGAPLTLYEPPFRERFAARHGGDPRERPDDDPEVLSVRAEVLSEFMAGLRGMLDAEAARRGDGRRLELAAIVPADEADNARFGIDLRRWVNEGLLDLCLPYRGAGGGRAKDYDLGYFQTVCAPRGVPVKPTFVAWDMPDPASLLRRAADYYAAGADGLTFWDAESAAPRCDRWAVVSRLGRRDELGARVELGAPGPVTIRFHRIGDWIVDGSYHPNWGF